ncbi:MAG: efflux RND transporter periplasmic adaptor subunit [Stanieria sp.]
MNDRPFVRGRLFALIVTVTLLTAACGKQEPPQATQPPAVAVKLQNLERNAIRESSEFVGSLRAKQRVILASQVDGRIVSISATEGETVRQGQLLIQLQLTEAQEEVNAAISNLNIQKANLDNATAQLRTAQAQEAAAAADVAQKQADLRQQEAEVELAKENLKRVEFLVTEGAESKQLLDERRRDLKTAQAQQDALKQALNASQKNLLAAQQGINAAEAAINREKAAQNQAEAQLGVAQEKLSYNRLVAPIDGVMGNIIPKVGDYIEAGQELTNITQNQTLELNLNVPIEQASQLKLGLPVEILDRSGQASVRGKISFIAPQVNRTQQSILAKATFPNNSSLVDEQFVKARVIWSQQPGVLVPTESVSRIAGKDFVFVAQEQTAEDGKTTLVAKQKPVTLGEIQGQAYQVISGIEAGEKLIVSGILNLSDGTPINPESLTSSKEE